MDAMLRAREVVAARSLSIAVWIGVTRDTRPIPVFRCSGLLPRKLINGTDPVYVLGVSPSAVAISPFGTRRSVGRINV
jgi:hypothetical protein